MSEAELTGHCGKLHVNGKLHMKESGIILEVSGIRDGKVMMALIQQGTQEDEQVGGEEKYLIREIGECEVPATRQRSPRVQSGIH